MARDELHDALESTSFLHGGNAQFLENLYARYQDNPGSVGSGWRDFFASLHDRGEDIATEVRGASWARGDWPVPANGELVSALDTNWGAIEARVEEKMGKAAQAEGIGLGTNEMRAATLDSIRALMMIRAYRVRGHLHANLDPLGLSRNPEHAELDPKTYGFDDDAMETRGSESLDPVSEAESLDDVTRARVQMLQSMLERIENNRTP